MGVEKQHVARGGKISFSEGGGGEINIIFGPKYRLLRKNVNRYPVPVSVFVWLLKNLKGALKIQG
jgi:hypothetical protein